MTTPNRPSGRSGATRDTGAVRDEHRRRFPLWLLLLGLLLLLLIVAGILIAALSGGSKKKTAAVLPVAPVTAASATPAATLTGTAASASPLAVPTAVVLPPASTVPAPPVTPTPTTAAPLAAPTGPPLVGGATLAPVAATGTLAVGDNEGTVLFAENSAALTANAKKVIADAASRVKATRPPKIVVTGYTDMIAGQPTNITLSQTRADNVEKQLHKDVGPGPTAYTTHAIGEKDPVATNDTSAGRQQNRRATITTD